ncbi:heme utilization cystosolic carrier protein HutX [Gammaproteobacteria bacterium ESL0073]|nr:heme utilization cystosolic carrier protein HutX [Gammaproteobacteria bacterium ESL0073]
MTQQALKDFLATSPDGTLEKVAEDYQCSLYEVISLLPTCTIIQGERFDDVWNEVGNWGQIVLLTHTADAIIEYSGELPKGTHKHGYFNLRKTNGLSGHIKAENCAHIALIKRKFMGTDTASIVFLNQSGAAMLKIFLGRDNERNLQSAQLERFDYLAQTLS